MTALPGPQAKKLKNEPAAAAKGAKKNGVKAKEEEEDDDDDDEDDDEVRISRLMQWPILIV